MKHSFYIKLVVVLVCLMFAPLLTAYGYNADPKNESSIAEQQQFINNQLDMLGVETIEQYWERLHADYEQYFTNYDLPRFNDLLFSNGEKLSISKVLLALFKFLVYEIVHNGKLLVIILMLSIFSMLLETLQNAFERQAISKIAYSVTYMVLVLIAINSFTVAITYAKDAIEQMISFMLAMIPLLLTLLASLGGVVTVSILHPIIIFMIQIVGSIIYYIVFPLLFFSAVLHIVSAITDKFKVSQLATMLRNIAITVLGVVLTIFLGVISIQGATSSVTDGLALKTAKYITGNFVPVVGKMFSDAADTVISTSLIAKNAIGIVGVLVLIFIAAFPALKIAAIALIYNVTGAILQPLGNSPITQCLQVIGKTLLYVFAALLVVSFMFFLAITIIITAGNTSVMIR